MCTQTNCQPYSDSWMTSLLALARIMPQILTFSLYIIGFWHKELYLLLFGIGMSISTLINWGINELAGDTTEPRVATCIPVHGAVISFESQQTAFFVTFVMGYIALYEARARIWHLLLLVAIFALVFFGDHLLNYHTAEATVAAALLGSLLAFCYQWLLYVAIVPTFPHVLRSRYMRMLNYEDTLCYTCSMTDFGRYVLSGFDARFGSSGIVTMPEVCDLVRTRIHDYLTREHTIFLARDIAQLEPLLVCKIGNGKPLSVPHARQLIEEYFLIDGGA